MAEENDQSPGFWQRVGNFARTVTGSGVIGGLIGAGASMLQQRRQNKFAEQMANQQNQWNKEAALESYQREVEMGKMQNEYNSPQAQMQRFKEAGLNPNLIYGQGSSGNATQMPKYDTPHMIAAQKQAADLSQAMNLANAFASYRTQMAQADKIAEEVKKAATENDFLQEYLGIRNNTAFNKSELARQQAQYWATDFLSRQELRSAQLANLRKQGGILEQELQLKRKTNDWFGTDRLLNAMRKGIPGLLLMLMNADQLRANSSSQSGF